VSYRCQKTGRAVAPGIPSVRITVAVRPMTYPPRPKAVRRRVARKERLIDDRGGQGLEIAREILVTPDEAAAHAERVRNGWTPEVEPTRPARKNRLREIEDALFGVEPPPPPERERRPRY